MSSSDRPIRLLTERGQEIEWALFRSASGLREMRKRRNEIGIETYVR